MNVFKQILTAEFRFGVLMYVYEFIIAFGVDVS